MCLREQVHFAEFNGRALSSKLENNAEKGKMGRVREKKEELSIRSHQFLCFVIFFSFANMFFLLFFTLSSLS